MCVGPSGSLRGRKLCRVQDKDGCHRGQTLDQGGAAEMHAPLLPCVTGNGPARGYHTDHKPEKAYKVVGLVRPPAVLKASEG